MFSYFFERKIACLICECRVKRRDILLLKLSYIFIYVLRKCLVVDFVRNHARNVIRIVHGMHIKGIKLEDTGWEDTGSSWPLTVL